MTDFQNRNQNIELLNTQGKRDENKYAQIMMGGIYLFN